jgi:hypothetical protein
MLGFHDFGHFFVRWIAQRRAFDGFFQKGRIRLNFLLAALMESNARAFESDRANSASSGFNEMLMVTAFIRRD